MANYTACTGSQQAAIDAHRVNVNGLGSKFAHMRGKSYGACPVCGRTGLVVRANGTVPAHKAQEQAPTVAPIVVDASPAGIYAAMMRANAREEAAPQSRLYGLLSDYLRRTLTRLYGKDGDAVYCAIVESGEASDDVISSTLATQEYLRADALAQDSGNRFFTAPDDIARELRHVMPICREWRAGLTEFASIGQHGTGYWTVTQGHTASGRMMERTDEAMVTTCVTRFLTSSDALAAVLAHGYR